MLAPADLWENAPFLCRLYLEVHVVPEPHMYFQSHGERQRGNMGALMGGKELYLCTSGVPVHQ